jgi:MATE family multidrug resistance protein
MMSYTLMTFTDKWLVSRLGPEFVGAQGNGGLAAWVPQSVMYGMLTVVNTYASQNLGAGRPERAAAYAWIGIWMGIAWWLFMIPVSFSLPWVFALAGIDSGQAVLATEFGQVLLWGCVFNLSTRALSNFFYGLHRAGVVMLAGIVANVVNLFASAVLVFGNTTPREDLGLFGRVCARVATALSIEPMGISGSAWGTVFATGIEFAIPLAIFLSPAMNRMYATRSAWRLSIRHIKDIVRIGWPGGAMFGNEMICWGFFMVYLVSGFGKEHASAGWIAHQYMSLSFMPAVGISVAATAIVGRYMGMGKPEIAEQRVWLAMRIALVYMGLCGVAFVVFRHALTGLFIPTGTSQGTADTIMYLGGLMLIATAAFQLFDAIAMVLSGGLRGAGDTVFAGLATIIASWVVIVGGGLAMTHFFPVLESIGAWIAAATYIFTLCVLLLWRFRTGKWKSITLVERAAEPATAGAMTTDGVG